MYNIGAANSPFKDVRVRQALNYCIDRVGIVTLLNGTADPPKKLRRPFGRFPPGTSPVLEQYFTYSFPP
jgi:ABC-type transport system substrate-binding protein